MSDWYTYDDKSKKALLILMERAKRPIKVTAGKLFDLSFATFTMVWNSNKKKLSLSSQCSLSGHTQVVLPTGCSQKLLVHSQ